MGGACPGSIPPVSDHTIYSFVCKDIHRSVCECVPPVPNGPHSSVTSLTQERICREEEEQLRKKKEAKKKKRKNKEEQVHKQRKLVKERGAEPEPHRPELERDEEKWWEQTEEAERKRREEEGARRWKEAMERKTTEMERNLREEVRRQEEILRKNLQALMDDEEEQLEEEYKERLEEVDEWMEKVIEQEEEEAKLRGDVFSTEEQEEPDSSDLGPPAEPEDELKVMEMEEEMVEMVENHSGLPPGCDVSDVTVTCDNLKLTYFPPLSMLELKSLSLEGESPAHTHQDTPSMFPLMNL